MRIIKGYICLVKRPSMFGMYGLGDKKTRGGKLNPRFLTENGVTPFPTLKEALEARTMLWPEAIHERDNDGNEDKNAVEVKRVSIRIAESEDDLKALEKSKALIIIVMGNKQSPRDIGCCYLIGRYIPGSFRYCGSSHLDSNGLKRFMSMLEARYAQRECARQSTEKCAIASFEMRYVDYPRHIPE